MGRKEISKSVLSKREFLKLAGVAGLSLGYALTSPIIKWALEGPESPFIAEKSWLVNEISAAGLFSLEVEQQPENSDSYITNKPDTVSLFRRAWEERKSLVFLAHIGLAGVDFSKVAIGDQLNLNYANNQKQGFRVEQIRHFQAIPANPFEEDFINSGKQISYLDLDNNLEALTRNDVYYSIYRPENPVVLQTCIVNDGIVTWGRLFVIAR